MSGKGFGKPYWKRICRQLCEMVNSQNLLVYPSEISHGFGDDSIHDGKSNIGSWEEPENEWHHMHRFGSPACHNISSLSKESAATDDSDLRSVWNTANQDFLRVAVLLVSWTDDLDGLDMGSDLGDLGNMFSNTSLDNYRSSLLSTNTGLNNLVLIDNPGFDKTSRSDSGIFKEIAQALAQYNARPNINEGFYLCRVDSTHLRRSSCKNLVPFRNIIGEGVVFTSMWKNINPTLDHKIYTQGCERTDGFRRNTKSIHGRDSLIIYLGYIVPEEQPEFGLLEYEAGHDIAPFACIIIDVAERLSLPQYRSSQESDQKNCGNEGGSIGIRKESLQA